MGVKRWKQNVLSQMNTRLSVFLIVVIGIIIVSTNIMIKGYVSYYLAYMQNQVLLSTTESLGKEIEQIFSQSIEMTEQLAMREVTSQYYKTGVITPELLGELNSLKASSKYITRSWLYHIDSGEAVEESGTVIRDQDFFTKRSWYKAIVVQRRLSAVTAAYQDIYSGKYVLSTVVPVLQGGGIVGIAGADINIEELASMLGHQRIGETGYISLVEADGKIISHGKGGNTLENVRDLHVSENLIDALKVGGEQVVTYKKNSDNYYGGFYKIKNKDLILIGTMPEAEFLKSQKVVGKMINSLNIIMVIGMSIIIYFLVTWQTRHIKQLKDYCQTIEEGGIDLGWMDDMTSRQDEVGVILRNIIQLKVLETEHRVITRQFDAQVEQYEMYKKQMDHIRRFKHDFKNHVIVIGMLMQSRSYEQLGEYVQTLGDSFSSMEDKSYFANGIADALVQSYSQKALEKNIKVTITGEIPPDLPIDKVSLCAILGNLLDNAIDAVASLTHSKEITLRAFVKNNVLCINIKNPYEHDLRKDGENYVTTKACKTSHGIGLRSVQEAIKKYDGYLDISDENDYFEVKVAIPLKIQQEA